MSGSSATTFSAAVNMPQYENSSGLDIVVDEAKQAQSRERFSRGPDRAGACKKHICKAAISGNWVKASSYDKTYPNWVCAPLTEDGDTALHIAVSLEQTSFVKKLLERTSEQDMEVHNKDGNTAFCLAVISGNMKIATILLDKNSGLVWITGQNGMLPIQLAFSAAQPHMAKYLFERTQQDMRIRLSFQNIVRLFFLALTYHSHVVARILLDENQGLVSAENEEGLTALEVLAQFPFCEDCCGILDSMFKHMEEEEEFPNSEVTSKAMFDATKSGNIKILRFILEYYPNLSKKKNPEGENLLQIATLHRQKGVFQLILSNGAYKNASMQEIDSEGNNILHLAAKLPGPEIVRYKSSIVHRLVLSEEMWFKEVEGMVPPAFKAKKNIEGLTPKGLFLKEHRDLSSQAATDLNQMANTFLVVATLIVILGIIGALTIRTNNIQGKTLVFSHKTWYFIFVLSVAVGILMCALSMVFFTSAIIGSVIKQKGSEYVSSRVYRVIYGWWLLFPSIGVMATFSTTSGAVLIYSFLPKWILWSVLAFGGIGVILFLKIYEVSLHRMICKFMKSGLYSLSGSHKAFWVTQKTK